MHKPMTNKHRYPYQEGNEVEKSMTEQREDALLQNELNNLQEYGDEYWDSGTGLFGKLGMSFGSSGKGERLFHELNKLGLKSEKENYAFINQELKNAGLDYQLSSELLEEEREKRQEGGLAIDEQMADIMPEEEAIPLETAEEPIETMIPDEEMEDNYVDFIVDEALDEEEEQYLLDRLNEDDQLSIIFDKVVETASEFSGAGLIEGPGSAVTDSIPARLSDGEFVMTSKAANQIGPDNLLGMMEQAEMDADEEEERRIVQAGGYITEEEEDQEIVQPIVSEKVVPEGRVLPETIASRRNKELMTGLNPRNSLFAS